MNGKLIIGTIVVFVIILVAFYFFSPRATAPTPETIDETDLEESTNEPGDTTSNETPTETPQHTQAAYDTSTGTSESESELPYNRVVTYDGEGFAPGSITIIEGGTIEFVNVSENAEMWVSSNDHPTHTLYPTTSETDCRGSSFDQCETVGQNGSWSFTFNESGTWGYHNHVRPNHTGEIEVVPVEDYLQVN